ncbi:SecD/SecF fusion protein [Balneicella halophila]|uniref:Multifunctional fusion protein n=1 Tax=Balneicella halophila TaxID=1537566 RepID=A0A7L4UQ07_BALHA|nr:protein translocase subunit SecDF [Balneicella halophila]PVX49830.1 SecD/SecF fusion protein [Balneicella halophila]
MQNKGLFLTLIIAVSLACLYALSFTMVTKSVERDARSYASGDLQKEKHYLDSMSSKEVYPLLGYTYKESKEREINLGLDLRGGMNVTMEVAVPDILVALSDHSKDENFNKAIALAKEEQKESQANFIDIFQKHFEAIAPNAKLSSIDIFGMRLKKQGVNENTSNDKVVSILKKEAEAVIDNTFNVLRTRIDKVGLTQPNITKSDIAGRIVIELPGVKDPERIRKLLQGAANLEFWEIYSANEIYPILSMANNKLIELKSLEATGEEELSEEADKVEEVNEATNTETLQLDSLSLGLENEKGEKIDEVNNPLFSLMSYQMQGGVVSVKAKDMDKVQEYLDLPQIKELFPANMKILWSGQSVEQGGEEFFDLYVAKVNTPNGQAPLTGDVMVDASQSYSNRGGINSPSISMTMDSEGANIWSKLTRKVATNYAGAQQPGQIAIVLDNLVYSAPSVREEINSRTSEITGTFTIQEAQDLATKLKSGKLPVPAQIVSEEIIGPSLGKEQVKSGMYSFIIAFVLVLVYMFFFYSKGAGLVANIALVANVFFVFGVLASFGAVLTLPGIAGIVLTIGMSVDANVLIYERVREELEAGKHIKKAVSDGYKNALSAIIDGNVTTFITGLILFVFGSGPIKGFATTLMIGIATSLFSAIFITRIIIENRLSKGKSITFFTKATENWLKNTKINFLGKRKIAYIISGILITIGLISLMTKGLNKGVDFTGGRTYVVKFDNQVNTHDLIKSLQDVYETQPEVKTYGGNDQVKITTKYRIDEEGSEIDDEVEALLYEGLKPYLTEGTTKADFLENNRIMSQKVGPTIADDIKRDALIATGFALIFIFLYILVRFRNWKYGLGAVAALAHDIIIVLGLFSVAYGWLPFSLEIDQAFIAAILTVVGYSINDTVVVFDRVREYIGLHPRAKEYEVVNSALNSTLRRTFSTSLSTFVVLLAIFLFGGTSIQGFIFALLIGVIVGTYSSLFIASPISYDVARKKK